MIIFGQNLALLFSYLNFNIFNLNYSINKIKKFSYKYWGLGIGDWGLGIGDWAQSPIPNPQSPIPNPHILTYL